MARASCCRWRTSVTKCWRKTSACSLLLSIVAPFSGSIAPGGSAAGGAGVSPVGRGGRIVRAGERSAWRRPEPADRPAAGPAPEARRGGPAAEPHGRRLAAPRRWSDRAPAPCGRTSAPGPSHPGRGPGGRDRRAAATAVAARRHGPGRRSAAGRPAPPSPAPFHRRAVRDMFEISPQEGETGSRSGSGASCSALAFILTDLTAPVQARHARSARAVSDLWSDEAPARLAVLQPQAGRHLAWPRRCRILLVFHYATQNADQAKPIPQPNQTRIDFGPRVHRSPSLSPQSETPPAPPDVDTSGGVFYQHFRVTSSHSAPGREAGGYAQRDLRRAEPIDATTRHRPPESARESLAHD